MIKKYLFYFSVICLGSVVIAQSSFEYLFPAPSSGSEYGAKCLEHKDQYIITSTKSSFYIDGGAIPFHSYNLGTIVNIIQTDGTIESNNLYYTTGQLSWSAAKSIYPHAQGFILPYRKNEGYMSCDEDGFMITPDNYKRGAIIISDDNVQIDDVVYSDPCDNEGVKYLNVEGSLITTVYRNSEDEVFFENRNSESNTVVSNNYLGEDGEQWQNMHAVDDGYSTFSQTNNQIVRRNYDANFAFIAQSIIPVPSNSDAFIGTIKCLESNDQVYLYFNQTIDDTQITYLLSVNSFGEIIAQTEFVDERIVDIASNDNYLLVLINNKTDDCSVIEDRIKVSFLDSDLNLVYTDYHGIEYARGSDICLTSDNHYVVVGTSAKPSQCYEENETTPYQAYIVKSPLPSLVLSESKAQMVSLKPNPSVDIVTIDTELAVKKVSIFDVGGALVREINQPISTFRIGDLAEGVYFFSIETEAYNIKRKFVKM